MRTVQLVVPSPPTPARLDLFLAAHLHGLSRRRVKTLIDAEAVRVDGRVERRGGRKLRPGDRVDVSYRPSELPSPAPLTAEALLARGDGWWAIAKPVGVPSHRSHDDGVGVPELAAALLDGAGEVHAAHRLDRATSGVLLLATPSVRGELAAAFAERSVAKRYLAVVSPGPSEPEGVLDATDAEGRAMRCTFAVERRSGDGARVELSVSPREGRTHQIRRQLAGAGWPIVGDLEHGRALPGGAARMALHCAELRWRDHVVACLPPPGWDALLEPPKAAPKKASGPAASEPERPHAPQRPGRQGSSGRPQLAISKASARIIKSGHPWVIADRDTGSLGRLRDGDVVDLVDASGRFVAMAVADPSAAVCARVVSDRQLKTLDDTGWRARAERAIHRRQALIAAPDTDALRLIHGQADGLPGLWVDLWGPCLVATRTARCCEAFTRAVYAALRERFEGLPLYEKDHWTDLRAADGAGGDALPGRWIVPPEAGHPAATGTWVVQEAGARFEVQPTAGLTTGLYPDQRRNRALLAERVAARPGGVAANLFAHTGAFSIALALAGAANVHTVDLSPKYLDVYRTNLQLNGLSEADHPAVAQDAIRWLQSAPRLDLVILDPPAFARGRGRGRGWNAQRDYAALVAEAARVMQPGGAILCCHNLRRAKKGWLRRQVEVGLAKAGRKLEASERAGPAPDFPTTRGFPEGHTFRGLIATVR